MTYLLFLGLQRLLAEALANHPQPVPGADAPRDPEVHIGTLPPKDKAREDFPFVLVRGLSGADDDGGHLVEVAIIVGVFDEAPTGGVQGVHNVIDVCRRALLVNEVIDRRFMREGQLTWQIGDDKDRPHPHPYYLGMIKAQYRGPHAVPPFPTEDPEDV